QDAHGRGDDPLTPLRIVGNVLRPGHQLSSPSPFGASSRTGGRCVAPRWAPGPPRRPAHQLSRDPVTTSATPSQNGSPSVVRSRMPATGEESSGVVYEALESIRMAPRRMPTFHSA